MATSMQEKRKNLLLASLALVVLSGAAEGATRDTAYSERGDPHRWYVPADTPREKYDNAAREARNALSDQLRECQSAHDRKRCEVRAHAQYRDDMARAREHLAPNRQLA